MAPTIISMPDIAGWTDAQFDPVTPRNVDRMEGRRTEAQQWGTSWWRASYAAPWLSDRDFGIMDAFMMRAGDSGEVFRAYDPFRMRPIAWLEANGNVPLSGTRAGGGSFNGTATLASISNSRQISISGLPANFQFRAGDYVEVVKSASLISLHRIVEDVAAGSGGTATLKIRYGLDTTVFAGATVVNFEKPSCLMQIDPGSYSGPKAWSSRNPSFSAQEVFFS
jgi:hypothetical protein